MLTILSILNCRASLCHTILHLKSSLYAEHLPLSQEVAITQPIFKSGAVRGLTCTLNFRALRHETRDRNLKADWPTRHFEFVPSCKISANACTQDWTTDHHSTYSSLNLHPLHLHRRSQKLKLTYKILKNQSCIPKSSFEPRPHPSPRSKNSTQLFVPFAPTSSYRYSFFIDVVNHWNNLPHDIIDSPSPNSFKTRLYRHTLL